MIGNKKKNFSRSLLMGGLRNLALCALMTALSIVCGKYLAFNAGPVMRFSFENLPILLSGIVFGPLWGGLVGAVADLLGCVMVAYPINPLVTAGAVLIGVSGGVFYRLFAALPQTVRLCGAVISAHLLGSLLVKTLGLAAYYDMPFYLLLLWRLLNYAIVGGVECFVLHFIFKNKSVRRLLEGVR